MKKRKTSVEIMTLETPGSIIFHSLFLFRHCISHSASTLFIISRNGVRISVTEFEERLGESEDEVI